MALKKFFTLLILNCVVLGTGLCFAESTRVRIKTDSGAMVLELYSDKAPATVDNFLSYARRFFYDGLIFHRVVNDFVIQGGGYTFDLQQKETVEPVVNESNNGLKNLRGTIAMARHSDPDSATSQFYINLKDNSNLDPDGDKPGYTVFGKVVEGMEVADQIGRMPVASKHIFSSLPLEPVQILSVREITAP